MKRVLSRTTTFGLLAALLVFIFLVIIVANVMLRNHEPWHVPTSSYDHRCKQVADCVAVPARCGLDDCYDAMGATAARTFLHNCLAGGWKKWTDQVAAKGAACKLQENQEIECSQNNCKVTAK